MWHKVCDTIYALNVDCAYHDSRMMFATGVKMYSQIRICYTEPRSSGDVT